MIGLFWIYKKKIYLKSIEICYVRTINGFKDCDFSHYETWDEIASTHQNLYFYEYEDIPRGRVVFDVTKERYIVYANREIITSVKKQTLILDAFKLADTKLDFIVDEHYKIY